MNLKRKYYAFDIDDNLVITSTEIYMQINRNGTWEDIAVSSSEYAIIKNDSNYRHTKDSFIDFSDKGRLGDCGFMTDFINAILSCDTAPSFDKFKECILNGYLFAFITARGHEITSFKKAVIAFIFITFTDMELDRLYTNLSRFYPNTNVYDLVRTYIDDCRFYGVSNPTFKQTYCSDILDNYKTEYGKIRALENFVSYLESMNTEKIRVGFSDDDIDNLNKVNEYMRNHNHTNIEFYLIDTSNENYDKKKIESVVL